MPVVMVLLGGSLGAACRYGVSVASERLLGDAFPWGTLLVNLAGCFLIGLAFSLGVERNLLSPQFRLLFVTGFLGALTTFSTYALESVASADQGLHGVALLALIGNNVGGLLLTILGIWVGRTL